MSLFSISLPFSLSLSLISHIVFICTCSIAHPPIIFIYLIMQTIHPSIHPNSLLPDASHLATITALNWRGEPLQCISALQLCYRKAQKQHKLVVIILSFTAWVIWIVNSSYVISHNYICFQSRADLPVDAVSILILWQCLLLPSWEEYS